MIRISGAIHSGADRGQKPAWSNSTKGRAREGTFARKMVRQGPQKETWAGCTGSELRMGQFPWDIEEGNRLGRLHVALQRLVFFEVYVAMLWRGAPCLVQNPPVEDPEKASPLRRRDAAAGAACRSDNTQRDAGSIWNACLYLPAVSLCVLTWHDFCGFCTFCTCCTYLFQGADSKCTRWFAKFQGLEIL